METKRCIDCKDYKAGMCGRYEVPVNRLQRCIETGIVNKVKELPKFVEDEDIDINNVVK